MPLRMVANDGYDRPILVCDHCGAVIEDVDDGNYQWRYDGLGDHPGAAVYFTHKRCCGAFEKANPGEWGALTLDVLFVYLANNLDLDWEAARARAEIDDRLE